MRAPMCTGIKNPARLVAGVNPPQSVMLNDAKVGIFFELAKDSVIFFAKKGL